MIEFRVWHGKTQTRIPMNTKDFKNIPIFDKWVFVRLFYHTTKTTEDGDKYPLTPLQRRHLIIKSTIGYQGTKFKDVLWIVRKNTVNIVHNLGRAIFKHLYAWLRYRAEQLY